MTNAAFTIFRKTSLLATAAAVAGVGGGAAAQHAAAGTTIENVATATVETAAGAVTIRSNSASFRVAELIDATEVARTSAVVPIASAELPVAFTITNAGNAPETFVLTPIGAVAGNQFDPTALRVAIDANGDGIYEPGIDTVVAPGGTTPVLAPDVSLVAFLIAAAPPAAADRQRASVRLDVQAAKGSGRPGTTLPHLGVDGTDAVIGATGAHASATTDLVVSRIAITLAKSASVVDPLGGTTAMSGARVTYRIVATAVGAGSAVAVHVIDTIPAGAGYVAGSLRLDGRVLSDAIDADEGSASDSGVDVSLGDQPAGTSHTIEFTVEVK